MKKQQSGIAIALGILFLTYPLTFGPACWLANRDVVSERHVAYAYMPLVYLAAIEPTGLLNQWANLAVPGGGMIFFLLQDLNPEPAAQRPRAHPS